MAAPLRKSILFQPHPLDTRYLIEVVDLLRRQGYSGVDYYDLGISLGLSPDTLDDIKEKDKGNARLCLIECLRAWLEQKDNVKSKGAPTYETLIQALREIGQNDVADGLERNFQVPPITPKPISTEDTPAADRIPDTQNPLTESKIDKWLEEGKIVLEITRINMHGAPGAGKTCSLHLLLNEPPPSSTDSTPIACPAVQATRISIGNNKWERVEEEDLLNQLASDLKVAPNETKHEKTSTKINEAQMSSDHSGEPSLEEPTGMEVIKDISDALEKGNAKNLSTNWVYFIDSGGQPAYRELLPLFTRAAALNIITIDLTKGLDDKCEFQYRISQHMSPIKTDLKYSNRGII
ncbi:PREDICTED: uncharacterized protein LOC109589531 [Amphimedon queenslandica]|uniref:Death domain-containing protein n=1 Tax=Amphimedon queenslandica TaxID=400682 RepID=A0A1X7T6J4_AMPQE|nr:PREDICTED: uncharacterized protein LOC109589531 [Amphimedon queenslandica]|eukprot:XP_019861152.1 PREDICTED: uncharacterized protein LOC109589531 [Amphimedon queenslandica]